MMETRDGREGAQRRRQAEDALAVVGVSAYALPLRRIQRPAGDPDSVWDADHAEVVNLPSTPDGRHVVRIKPRREGCGLNQAGDPSRMPRCEGRREVDEVGQSTANVVQMTWTDAPVGLGFDVLGLFPN